MKLTKRKGFNFFRSYYDVYNEFENDKQKVEFIDALLNRQFQGIKPEGMKGLSKFAYISQVNSIDTQVKGYEDKLISLNKGVPNYDPWQGVKEKVLTPTLQVQVQEEVQGKEKEEVKGEEVDSTGSSNELPEIVKPKRINFKPPELFEVQEYCRERNNNVDPQRYIDHYTSNGWLVGKNKMKDWKAAVRTWEKNTLNNGKQQKPTSQDRIQTIANWGKEFESNPEGNS